ncbi:MAG: type IV pilus modification PilV family protein [Desulfobacteria bacterium]
MKNNDGMTLVEVLVAMAIVFIVFLGMSSAGLVVLDQNIKNSQRDEAVGIAEMELQQTRNTQFSTLTSAPDNVAVSIDNVSRQIRGLTVNYGVWRTVNHLNTSNLQVSIRVTWTRIEKSLTRSYDHTVITIVRST